MIRFGLMAALAIATFYLPAANSKVRISPSWRYIVHPGDGYHPWKNASAKKIDLPGVPKGWSCSISEEATSGSWEAVQVFYRVIDCKFQDQTVQASLECSIDQRTGEKFWRSGYHIATLTIGKVNLNLECE